MIYIGHLGSRLTHSVTGADALKMIDVHRLLIRSLGRARTGPALHNQSSANQGSEMKMKLCNVPPFAMIMAGTVPAIILNYIFWPDAHWLGKMALLMVCGATAEMTRRHLCEKDGQS